MSHRSDLVTHLKTFMTVPKRQFYDHGADIIKLPAVVVRHGEPMCELDTMGGARMRWHLEVDLISQRANAAAAADWAEDTVTTLLSGLYGTQFWFVDAGQPEQATFNNLEAVVTTCNVQVVMGN